MSAQMESSSAQPGNTKRVDVLITSAYAAACAADEAFQAELVRQFGKEAAGEYRYRRVSHDARTAASREKFHTATRDMRAALSAREVHS